MVSLEPVDERNEKELLKLCRGDIPAAFVEDPEYTIRLNRYGRENGLRGMCLAVKYREDYAGIILVGEAILEDSERRLLEGKDPFRIMGFLIDCKYRGRGIGREALGLALDRFYREFGRKPLLLGCHWENTRARKLYESFGFVNTGIRDADDYLMIRN